MHRVVVYSLCLIRPLVHCALRLIDDRLYVFYPLVVPSLWQSTSLTVLYIKLVFKAVFRQCSTHNYGSMVEPVVPSLQEDLLWTIGELGGTTRKIALWKNGVRRYFQKDRLLILLQIIKRLWITENRHLLYVKKSVEALVDNVGNGLRPHSSASSEPEAVGPLKKEGLMLLKCSPVFVVRPLSLYVGPAHITNRNSMIHQAVPTTTSFNFPHK